MKENVEASEMTTEPSDIFLAKLKKDIAAAAATMTPREARFLVDLYYQVQAYRIALGNQIQAGATSGEPHAALSFFEKQATALEHQVRKVLDLWTADYPLSKWARSICGIGPVIAAGLRAHVDISKLKTAGQLWRYAGLDPSRKWLSRDAATLMARECMVDTDTDTAICRAAGRVNVHPEALHRWAHTDNRRQPVKFSEATLARALARRPFNASLKTLCAFKIGESFVKVQSREEDIYGKIYKRRKLELLTKSEAGGFAAQAAEKLRATKIGKGTDAYKAYADGKFPPAHLHAMARRHAVKLFLAHYFEVGYRLLHGSAPPLPYPIAIMGHGNYNPPPNMAPAAITESTMKSERVR